MKEQSNNKLGVAAYDELVNLSDRIYCAWQCALHGDDMMIDHGKKLGGEMYRIWHELENIIVGEEVRLQHIEEEMKKFEQGFAYRAPNAQVTD
jgi:hypothetical protein